MPTCKMSRVGGERSVCVRGCCTSISYRGLWRGWAFEICWLCLSSEDGVLGFCGCFGVATQRSDMPLAAEIF